MTRIARIFAVGPLPGGPILLAAALFLAAASPAQAYIGPGAGFALLGSFLAIFLTMLAALASLFTWPIRWLVRALRSGKAYARADVKRLVIVGLDGLDPDVAEHLISEGQLPNLARLAQSGCFTRLATTLPPLSPVAWSTFQTGVNPGKHNVFDFLTRDPKTYLPNLASVEIRPPAKTLTLGKYIIPLSKPGISMQRKSQPFWHLLGRAGIFSCVIRVPVSFPPERFAGLQLAAMCTPDLRGTQGTFCFYTEKPISDRDTTGGNIIAVKRTPGHKRINAHIIGPPNPLTRAGHELRLPFTVTLDGNRATLRICRQRIRLTVGQYSDWIELRFRPGLGLTVYGLCRFLLKQTDPHFEMYVTPINIHPRRPALPISHPRAYSIYLTARVGPFATLGLAEDTWALNEKIISEQEFLAQCADIHRERCEMFLDALDKTPRGVCICVFDASDRIQHMFGRYTLHDPAAKNHNPHNEVVQKMYRQMDQLVGQVAERIGPKDVLIVMSDHGLKPFDRAVELNAWLQQNGYLHQRPDADGRKHLRGIDFDKTRAYAVGLSGLYLNLAGREANGIVKPHQEADQLKAELIQRLSQLSDPASGKPAIRRVFDSSTAYRGPYTPNAPDLIVGYHAGYRASWDTAVGAVGSDVFCDNDRHWSADHCMDPAVVPGVFFCNRKINVADPRIVDLAPTALRLFGLDPPQYMDGKALFDPPPS